MSLLQSYKDFPGLGSINISLLTEQRLRGFDFWSSRALLRAKWFIVLLLFNSMSSVRSGTFILRSFLISTKLHYFHTGLKGFVMRSKLTAHTLKFKQWG